MKRYLAGFVPAIAKSMVFGVGGRAEAVGDTALQFEVARAPIFLTSYDFVNNKLIFKAQVPESFSGTIYEVGLFSLDSSDPAGAFGSRVLSSFDSDEENWVDSTSLADATFTTANVRIGADALLLSPVSGTPASARLDELTLDLSGNSGADLFSLAFFAGSNISNFTVRFKTDESNYFTYTVTSPTAGYNLITFAKSTAAVTGVPSWSSIATIQFTATSTATTTLTLDGLRIEDTDTTDPEYVLVSRRLPVAPIASIDGQTQEVEFALDVTV